MIFNNFRNTSVGLFLERSLTGLPVLPNAIKYGKIYRTTQTELKQSQYFSKEQLNLLQFNKLKKILSYSYNNIPYYKELMDINKIQVNDIRQLEDLKNIPLLTKEIIRERERDLISPEYKNQLELVSTSGSSGTPLKFYWQKQFTENLERAFIWHIWKWKNIRQGERLIQLRGTTIPNDRPFVYRRGNRLIISTYNLNQKKYPEIISEIRRFKPVIIQAYPSALFQLTKLILENEDVFPNKVKAILTSSEKLYSYQEELFNDVYNSDIFDWYGHSERAVLIHRCEKNRYHIIPEYGFTELINDNGNWCKNEGEEGQIVTTGFNNYAMPLIRYKTDDIATNSTICCECGRAYQVVSSIEGRSQEYLVSKDSTLVSYTSLINAVHDKLFEKMERIQLRQDNPGEIDFHYISKHKIVDAELNEILVNFQNKLGKDVVVNFKKVNEIQLSKRGKFKVLVQNIPLDIS